MLTWLESSCQSERNGVPFDPQKVPYSAWGGMQEITAIIIFKILLLFPHKRKDERNWCTLVKASVGDRKNIQLGNHLQSFLFNFLWNTHVMSTIIDAHAGPHLPLRNAPRFLFVLWLWVLPFLSEGFKTYIVRYIFPPRTLSHQKWGNVMLENTVTSQTTPLISLLSSTILLIVAAVNPHKTIQNKVYISNNTLNLKKKPQRILNLSIKLLWSFHPKALQRLQLLQQKKISNIRFNSNNLLAFSL